VSIALISYLQFNNKHFTEIDEMAATMQQNNDVPLPVINELEDTELSLESTKYWKPDRKVKMALAVQAFCVVRCS
jgi:hypothetical protein